MLPGWKGGTQLTYEGCGDEDHKHLPGDLVVTVVELKHDLFRRVGNDLVFVKLISLREVGDSFFSLYLILFGNQNCLKLKTIMILQLRCVSSVDLKFS